MSRRPSSLRFLIAAFACVAISFVFATAVAEYDDFKIKVLANDIIANSSSSIDHISNIRASIRRLEVLVDDYVDGVLAAQNSASAPPDSITQLRPAISSAEELRVEPFTPCTVACGPGVLMSLIGNLVRNAIKYMGDQPVRLVDLSVRDLYSCVRIEVQDTGPGLADGLGERAFDPYVRGTPRSEHTGLGLGLATVKRLVEAHGGKVGVRSEPGTGCLFWFELPKGAPPQAA